MTKKVKTSIIGAKFKSSDAELIRKIAKIRGECVSEFLRYAIFRELARLGYLDEERKKALGMRGVISEQ